MPANERTGFPIYVQMLPAEWDEFHDSVTEVLIVLESLISPSPQVKRLMGMLRRLENNGR